MAKLRRFSCLKIKHFVIFLTISTLSCRQNPVAINAIQGERLVLDSTLVAMDSVAAFIAPYHDRINTVLDSTLAYAPYAITKTDGALNTTAGNLMADLILEMANPIYEKRTGETIDFVLLNHGGIRAVISKGNVSARTAYEVMPFENDISVVTLSGASVTELVHYIVRSKRAHPFSGLQLMLQADGRLKSFAINGAPVDAQATYHVATSDYLVSGGDDMVFFKNALQVVPLGYKIRNAMIDYFSKVDTLKPRIDQRYLKLP